MTEIQEISEISSILSVKVLLIVWAIVFLLAFVISAVLFYHWRKYGAGNAVIITMEVVYLVGVAAFLSVAVASALLF